MSSMVPDPIFSDPRLALLYDTFDGDRSDLPSYLRLAEELGARSLLDIGCGTGAFAIQAARAGMSVVAVDPAAASLSVARRKAGASRVLWHEGTAQTAPMAEADLASMTGNVAMVFLTDDEWLATLGAVRERLAPAGHLVYETRRPEARAWESWARDDTDFVRVVDGVGPVRQRREVLAVSLPFVSFRYTYTFPDGAEVESVSTLRYRGDAECRRLLSAAGMHVVDVRDAPDRPGLERVYLARPLRAG